MAASPALLLQTDEASTLNPSPRMLALHFKAVMDAILEYAATTGRICRAGDYFTVEPHVRGRFDDIDDTFDPRARACGRPHTQARSQAENAEDRPRARERVPRHGRLSWTARRCPANSRSSRTTRRACCSNGPRRFRRPQSDTSWSSPSPRATTTPQPSAARSRLPGQSPSPIASGPERGRERLPPPLGNRAPNRLIQ